MKKFVIILIGLVLFVCMAFFALGKKSQSGSPIGLQSGKLAECPNSPNVVSSEDGTPDKKQVTPLQGSMEQAKAAILALGGTVTSENDGYLSATFTSGIFKFVDDVELRPGESGYVHIRSASRVGYSDRGANRKRVEAIRAKMNS